MVARLDQIKDQALLIQAFARCKSTVWDLVLVGDGPCRGALEELSRSCGLDPSKIFLGKRLDIPEILGSLDLFAFSTTEAEGFGIVLIEAMAAGLPVIASDVPACREVLADGAAGVLVPPGDVQAWIIGLGELMSQPKTVNLAEAWPYEQRPMAMRLAPAVGTRSSFHEPSAALLRGCHRPVHLEQHSLFLIAGGEISRSLECGIGASA